MRGEGSALDSLHNQNPSKSTSTVSSRTNSRTYRWSRWKFHKRIISTCHMLECSSTLEEIVQEVWVEERVGTFASFWWFRKLEKKNECGWEVRACMNASGTVRFSSSVSASASNSLSAAWISIVKQQQQEKNTISRPEPQKSGFS